MKNDTDNLPSPQSPVPTGGEQVEDRPESKGLVGHQENHGAANKNMRLNDGQYREQNAPIADGVTLPVTDKGKEAQEVTEQPQNTSNGQAPAQPTPGDQKRRHDTCMLIANSVMACAAVAAVIVASCQWSAMRSQLTAMNKQADFMSDQLKQMKADSQSSSGAMSNELDIMTKQWSVMDDQLRAMREASKSDSVAWDRQLNIMQGQLTQMQDASHLEQRAWIGCERTARNGLDANKTFEVTVTFFNTGKTPAVNVIIEHGSCWGKPGLNMQDYIDSARVSKHGLETTDQAPVAPNAAFTVTSSSSGEKMTKLLVLDIKVGATVVYVFGCISYEDCFGGQHQTKYCFTVDPLNATLAAYDQYNDMN